jgi:hypothetical protein
VKLEGSLDAFSLQDIFQLLSFTRKTGGLHLRSGRSDGVVWFSGGALTGASADSTRQGLARRLIGAGAVSDEALAAAVQRAAEGEAMGVTRALLEAAAVDADTVRDAAREQIIDAVFDLLRWTDGDFAFAVDQHNPDDVGIAVPMDDVVAEATARREAWQAIAALIPSPETVLGMPVTLPEDPALSRDEWALLALADGRRTVAELVDLGGRGAYAVVSSLAGLVERGLLVARDGEDHVAVMQRRHGLLTPLESETFQPAVVSEPNATAPSPQAPVSAPDAEATAAETPAPFETQPDEGDAAAEAPVESAPPHDGPAADAAGSPDHQLTHDAGHAADSAGSADAPAGDGAPEGRPQDGVPPQSGADESGADETGTDETSAHETSAHETSPHETSAHETSAHETGAHETRGSEATAGDGGNDDQSGSDGSSGPDAGASDEPALLGGAHVPADVVPARPEPFLPRRQAEFDETTDPGRVPAAVGSAMAGGASVGNAAVAAEPASASLIERDPSINRSLMLRLIAGVRGL